MENYIYIIGYTGHYLNDTEVLRIVDNQKDLDYVKGWFVDSKIVDEEGAKLHIQNSNKNDDIWSLGDLSNVDKELLESNYTTLQLVYNSTKNQISQRRQFA